MLSTSIELSLCLVATMYVWSPSTCHAERDPETVARQAEIDHDLAEAKINELQREQEGEASAQIDNSEESDAKSREIANLQTEAAAADRRRLLAEAREK